MNMREYYPIVITRRNAGSVTLHSSKRITRQATSALAHLFSSFVRQNSCGLLHAAASGTFNSIHEKQPTSI